MANYEEAESLASQIRIGSLSLKLEEMRSEVVGAQLGEEAISSSLKAAAIGLVIVMIFMIVQYLVPGVVAAFALAIYTTLVIATLYLFEITLTLPGIAGIILSIGMAVDATVIIFARIREEIADGKICFYISDRYYPFNVYLYGSYEGADACSLCDRCP